MLMENFLFLDKSSQVEQLSKSLGFTKNLFVNEDFVFVKSKDGKIILSESREAKKKGKIIIFQPLTEDILRFVLERKAVDIIIGVEQIHFSDSFHHVRGGLDQVLCTLAVEQGITIAFSFSEILNSSSRAQLLARMSFNISLCKKYKVKTLFSNFCAEKEEMRSSQDLETFWKVLQKQR